MSDGLSYVLSVIAGLALGTFYFGGLWWTVERIARVRNPGLLYMGSLLVRLMVVVGVFYFLTGGRWERLAFCVGGLLVARFAVMGLLKTVGSDEGTSELSDGANA